MLRHGQAWPLLMAEGDGEGTGGGGSGEPGGTTASAGGTQAPESGLLRAGDSLLDYRTGLPENLRSAPVIQRMDSLDKLAQAVVEQDRMLGRALFLPEDTADEQTKLSAMQKVYARLGRPDTAEAYVLPAPEGKALDAEIQSRWQRAFHKAGLSQAQVQEVMDEYWRTVSYADNLRAGQEATSASEAMKTLYAEFGASTDAQMQKANRFFEHFGAGAFGGKAGADAWAAIKAARLPDGKRLDCDPNVIACFAEAGARLGEGEWYDTDVYRPGQDTLKTLTERKDALTAKRHNNTITADEQTELRGIFRRLAAHQERESLRNGTAA